MKNLAIILSLIVSLTAISCKEKKTSAFKVVPDAPAVAVQQKMIAAKIFVKPGKEDEFIKSAKMIIDSTHTEKGCLEYTLYQDPVNKSDFLMFERYTDQAAIDTHFAAHYFKAFGKIAGELTRQATEIKIYNISESH